MKVVFVVSLAVFTLCLAVDVDKCLLRFKKCRSEQDDAKKVCVKEKKSGKFYNIDSECDFKGTNCICSDCLEKAHESKCQQEDDDPEDNDTGIDKCIEKVKSCEAKEDEAERVCVKDDSDNFFEIDSDCKMNATNCLCDGCIHEADQSNCNTDKDGDDDN